MVEFAETSIEDLAKSTAFLHHIKPSLQDKLVYGIEKHKPLDRNVIFHLMPRNVKSGHVTKDMLEVFMLSAEYIIEHSYWKGDK